MTLPEPGTPIVLEPGEGRSVAIGPNRCTFKVLGKDTAGHFGLFEYTMAAGSAGPRPHVHHEMVEIFYVAEGEVQLEIGERTVLGHRGTVALVPRESLHAFSNPGPRSAVLLIMFCPADSREGYFEGLAELTAGGRRPDPQALLDLMRRYDQEPI